MFKNLTLKQLSLFAAILIASVFLLVALCLFLFKAPNPNLITICIGTILVFLLVYLVVLKLLEKYVYRRIKLIYKIIHSSKVSVKDDYTLDINDNILERVETEVEQWVIDQREEIESLKNLEKYRRNFLGNISHELKTPIFSVQGYIHTLIDSGLEDETINLEYLSRAATNVERLQTIVEDLEVISKLESGSLVLEQQDFDIKDLTQSVIEEVEMPALKNNINIHLKEGADKSFMVTGDRESIRTVLSNLLVNSIKYGKKGGRTKVGFYDMDNYILIEVADNGLGIEEKHLKHLFDRFYRVDKSRSRDKGGSGLGLSIVKHIIEAHNQRITVRSTPNLGSTFGFTLAKASKSGSWI